eukprot:gene26482-29020_t
MAANIGGLIAADAVSVAGLRRRFGARTILDGVDLTIRRGEFVALLGRSGSGKSTFLRSLAGIDHGADGDGVICVPDDLSVVFQDARLLPWKRVLDNVALGLPGHEGRVKALIALNEGSAAELRDREDVRAFYLGLAPAPNAEQADIADPVIDAAE